MNRPIWLILLAFALLVQTGSAAQIKGYVYDLYTLELVNNSIVEINSEPPQQMVARDGFYSFAVPKGQYLILAQYSMKGLPVLYTEENITVNNDGNFELDLLMEPVGNSTYSIYVPDIPLEDKPAKGFDLGLVAIGFLLIAFLYYYNKKRHIGFLTVSKENKDAARKNEAEAEKKGEAKEPLEETAVDATFVSLTPKEELSDEANAILEVLGKSDGRLTQKEIRKIFKFSEAKMSNLLDDLEQAGRIRRIKQGRGNVIRLI